MTHSAIGPQHTIAHLVTHLHHIGLGTLRLESKKRLLGVVIDSVAHLVIRECLPCLRHYLLCRVCPIVRVVEVEKKHHAGLLDALSHDERVLQVAIAITLRVAQLRLRVNKQTQTDVVHTIVAKYLNGITLDTSIRKSHTTVLLRLQP